MFSQLDVSLFIELTDDLITPDVTIFGDPLDGESFNLTCTLDGIVGMLVGAMVDLSFVDPQGGMLGELSIEDGSTYTRNLFFDIGKTSDAGNYTCVATVDVTYVQSSNFTLQSNDSQQIIIQGKIAMILYSSDYYYFVVFPVPSPQLNITVSPSTSLLYETTAINLTCLAILNADVVNTAVTVSSVWTGPSGVQLNSSSHITVMDMLQSPPYTSVLVFNPVDDVDSGEYQCNMTVSQNNNNTAILPSMNSSNITIEITGLHCHTCSHIQ